MVLRPFLNCGEKMKNYTYPKECFSINETNTKNAKAAFERKYDAWYAMAEKMYPNYLSMSLRERIDIRNSIDNAIGYHI